MGGFCIPAFREFAIHVHEAGRHLCPRRLNRHPEYFSEESQTVVHLQHSSREVALVFILEHLLSEDVCGGVSQSRHRQVLKALVWQNDTLYLELGCGFWFLVCYSCGEAVLAVRFGRVNPKSSQPTCHSLPGQF